MEKPVIVVVDDDPSVREGTTDLLNAMGFSTEAFESAEGFLNSEIRSHTSCLVADVQMPGMSGIELHKQLAASGTPIPTILITAFPDTRARTEALQVGVTCYLAKPFDEQAFLACIHLALEPRDPGGSES